MILGVSDSCKCAVPCYHSAMWCIIRQTHASMQCMSACLLMCVVAGQVVVQLAVDKSRSVCLSVANGEVDVAIIGGHVPEDLKDALQVMLHGLVVMLWVTTCAEQTVPSKTMFPFVDSRQQAKVPWQKRQSNLISRFNPSYIFAVFSEKFSVEAFLSCANVSVPQHYIFCCSECHQQSQSISLCKLREVSWAACTLGSCG